MSDEKDTPPKDESSKAAVEVVDDDKVKKAMQTLAQQQQQAAAKEMSQRYLQDVASFLGDRMLCPTCQKPYRLHPIFKLQGDDHTVRPLVPIPPLGILSCGECGKVEFFAVDVLAHTIRKKNEDKQS
jgi:hypothetical protein